MSLPFGRAEVLVDGTFVPTKKGVKVMGIVNVERRSVVEDTFHGIVTETIPARCELNLTAKDDINLTTIANLVDTTVIVSSMDGTKKFVLRNAFCTGANELTTGEGETTFAFEGAEWEEVIN
jgi:hypothetical protein